MIAGRLAVYMCCLTRAMASVVQLCCRTPVLLIGSGQDRLLPSLTEQTRLQGLLPNAQRLVLPESGHTALLEVLLLSGIPAIMYKLHGTPPLFHTFYDS